VPLAGSQHRYLPLHHSTIHDRSHRGALETARTGESVQFGVSEQKNNKSNRYVNVQFSASRNEDVQFDLRISEAHGTVECPRIVFAEAQLSLSHPSTLAILEQALLIERFEPLAKIINFTEYGDQLGGYRYHTPVLMALQLPPPYPELRLLTFQNKEPLTCFVTLRRQV
jgi:hypothetical protein